MPPPAATTFKTQDMPGTPSGTTYSYWSPSFSYYSVSAPGGSLPNGYPSDPSHVPGSETTSQAAPTSMGMFNASPGALSTVDYVATPCPDCGQLVKVSPATTYHMDKHRESQRCKRSTARRSVKEEEAKASATRIELFSNFPGQGTARDLDQGAGGFVSGGSASAVKPYNSWNMSDTKGKGKEIPYSTKASLEKRYCDAGVQADVVLVQEIVPAKRKSQQTTRRCQSEPPLFHTELQAIQGRSHPSGVRLAEDKCEKETVTCFQCEEILLRRNVRSHVGGHALRQLVGAPEGPSMKYAVHPGNPCGFCGRASCDIRLVKAQSPASKYTAAASSCHHAHTFSLNKARRFSTVMPCTNLPIQCALCPKDPVTKLRPVHWKYNMFHHIQTTHPDHWDWQARRVKNLGVNFRRLLSISQRELDTVAPGRTRPYPGPVGEAEEGEEEPVISNKRAAVEALIRSTSGDSPQKGTKGS